MVNAGSYVFVLLLNHIQYSIFKFLLTRAHGIALKMNDVSIESRRKRRAFRAPALFYFMVVMRAALQQNINHFKVPQFYSFSRVSQT